MSNDKLDQGITSIKYVDNDPAKGALITVVNNEQLVLPVPLRIEEENGKTDSMTLPAEIWQRGGKWTFHYASTSKIKMVTIDPSHDYPDVNPSNNSFSGPPVKPVPQGTTAADVINKFLKAVGGADKIKNIKDFSYTASGSVQGQDILLISKYKAPDRSIMSVVLTASNTVVQKTVVNGDSVSMSSMGQARPVDAATAMQAKAQGLPFPELDYLSTSYQLSLAPALDNIDGKDVYVVNIASASGMKSREYFDAETGLRVRKETTSGVAPSIINYADYKEANGIMYPSSETISQGVDIHLDIKDVKVNSGLKDEEFK